MMKKTLKSVVPDFSTICILLLIGILFICGLKELVSLFTPYEESTFGDNVEPEFDLGTAHYVTGTYTEDACEYEYYAERMYPDSSLSTFYSIVNSELELYENMSDEYSYEMNLDYDGLTIAVLKGEWKDINYTKASIIIHNYKDTYVRNYYMDIVTYDAVTEEQFTKVCNELLEKFLNNI